jgi:GTP cyclohydrolase II
MPADPAVAFAEILDLSALKRVNRAMAALRRHEMTVAAYDGRNGETEAVLALAVETVTPEDLAQLQRLAGAPPALMITGRRAAALGLGDGQARAVRLTFPGGADMATALALADPEYMPGEETVRRASVEPASGAAAAALELARIARLLPSVVIAPLDPGKRGVAAWAARHDLLTVSAQDVADYAACGGRTLRQVAEACVPLVGAEKTRIVAFRPSDGGPEHLAIVIGDPEPGLPVLARLHSECFTGDLLGSLRCDCGDQLRGAIAEINKAGSGVLLYLAQEGRGIGLINKLRAYQLQDRGLDTVDANEALGFDADERVYLPAAEMLRQLGFDAVRLMTNNPDKLRQLARCGVEVVERVPHVFAANGHNLRYLATKAERSGHLF